MKKKIFLMQTPTHRNLGDHAIAYAEHEFVKNKFNEYKLIEIPYENVYKYSKHIKNIMKKDDYIFIIGGGNMGDMYAYEEYMRRFIISYFKDFKIVSFPQTISFSNSLYGKMEMLKSKYIYSKNKNLLIVARELKSYNLMKELYKNNNVIMTPDIVLYLDKRDNLDINRDGIVTCLRKDKEQVLNDEDRKFIFNELSKTGFKINNTDTIVEKDVSINLRASELGKIWSLVRGAEVVITDRLHGMIFCAITATPCIVFRNSNHKIEETYNNWLSDIEYIKFFDMKNRNEFINLVNNLSTFNKKEKCFNSCKIKFNLLIEKIKTMD